MKRLLLLFVLILLKTTSYAQHEEYQQLERLPESFSVNLLNGTYEFSYQGLVHQVEISSELLLFSEFTQSGDPLGGGSYYIEQDRFVFFPNEISQESVITEPLYLRIIEEDADNRKVIVQPIDSKNGIILDLTKL